MKQFRIYYDTHEHVDDPEKADNFGVIAILQKRMNDGGVQIVSGVPYYIWDGYEWLPAQENDIIDRLIHDLPIQKLLVGRLVNKAQFIKVYEKAKEDRKQLP